MNGRKLALAFVSLGALLAVTVSLGAQQQVDRSKPPVPGPPPALKMPPVERRALTNGIRVFIVPLQKVPVVHVQFVTSTGGGNVAGKAGLPSLVAAMLDEGAGGRSALQIAEAIEDLGAQLTTSSRWDAATVDLHVPVAHLAAALPIMGDVVFRPTFPETELARLKDERAATLLQSEDDPEELIRFAFPRLLYGPTHPYGTSMLGTAESIRSFSSKDLRAFHDAAYQPKATSAIVVTGSITADAIMPLLEKTFQTASCCAAPAGPAVKDFRPVTARQLYLIDKPGAAQTQIRIGALGAQRSTPDFFALRVLNTILGEAFTSRLNSNLREEHGYTYGASSRFDMRRGIGPFFAGAAVQTDKTTESLREFFNELKRIHDPIPPEELEKAKTYLSLQMLPAFETTRSTADAIADTFIYDLPADYYTTYADRVRGVTAADVKRAADKYIVPDKLLVVIIGDRKAIEAGVKSLNLGPITIVPSGDIFK
jgi:predicted Zn-dependent peptidase